MRDLMKKYLLSLFLLVGLILPLKAELIQIEYKGLNLQLPFQEVSSVYVYDFISERSMVGGETIVAGLFDNKIRITFGAISTVDIEGESDRGIPFIGFDIDGTSVFSERFTIGGFVAKDTSERKNIAGLKASLLLW